MGGSECDEVSPAGSVQQVQPVSLPRREEFRNLKQRLVTLLDLNE